jgi:hypothetical protein
MMSRVAESYPSTLTEPDVQLSLHPAPAIWPPASRLAANEQNSVRSRRATRPNHYIDAGSRRRNLLYFRRADLRSLPDLARKLHNLPLNLPLSNLGTLRCWAGGERGSRSTQGCAG